MWSNGTSRSERIRTDAYRYQRISRRAAANRERLRRGPQLAHLKPCVQFNAILAAIDEPRTKIRSGVPGALRRG